MNDESKTQEQLIQELTQLRLQIIELEKAETQRKQIAAAVRESEERFKALYQENPIPTFTWRKKVKDFELVDYNNAAKVITNGSVIQFLGKTATELYRDNKNILQDLQQCFAEKRVIQRELQSQHFIPGKLIIVTYAFVPPDLVMVHIEDITERKQAELELVSAQERLKEAHRLAHIGTWDWVMENDTVTWSEELFSIAGRDPSLPAPTYAEHPFVYTPASWDSLSCAVTRALTTGEPYTLELELVRPDGNLRWINAFGGVKRDRNGKIIGLHGTLQDITDRKRAEETLRESEEKFRQLFTQMPSAVAIYAAVDSGEDFIFKDFNKAAEKIEGIKKDDLIGKCVTQVFPGVKDFGIFEVFQRVWRTGQPEFFPSAIYRDEHDPGTWRESWVYKLASGEIVAIYHDITEHKRAEKTLQTFAELGLKLAKVDSLDALAIPVAKAVDTLLNYDAFLFCQRLPGGEMFKMVFAEDIIHGKRQEIKADDVSIDIYRPMGNLLQGEPFILNRDPAEDLQGWIRFGDESRPSASLLFLPVCFGEEVCGLLSAQSYTPQRYQATDLAILKSIADTIAPALRRIQMETILRESESRYQQFIQNTPDVVYSISAKDGILTSLNPAFEKVTGWSRSGWLGKSFTGLIHLEDVPLATKTYQQVLAGITPPLYELRFRAKSGNYLIGEFTSIPQIEQGKVIGEFGIIRDITERKTVEEAIKLSRQKLRNLAIHLQSVREEERTRIAREIHDELGQSLTALKMDVSWLGKRFTKEQNLLSQKTKDMELIIDHTIKTVKRLSAELRPGLLDDLGLPAAIEWQASEFSRHSGIPSKVSINPTNIIVNREGTTGLFRIFQETLTNIARHAHATKVTISLVKKRGQTILTVKDNGKGISSKQINSAKSLGLIGMRERVGYLEGTVDFKGIKGKGTTVIVSIPEDKP